MTILKILGVVFVLFVAGALVLAAMKPDTFRVERSASVKASPEKILARISDFKAWSAWSPYENKDPAMTRTFGTVTAGKGAVYEWSGNKNVGKGRMEITDAAPSKIVIKLDFLEPFEAHNTAEFSVAGKDGMTTVTWAMYGPANFVSKLMGVFFNMDRMIGTDFEAGLVNLKKISEN